MKWDQIFFNEILQPDKSRLLSYDDADWSSQNNSLLVKFSVMMAFRYQGYYQVTCKIAKNSTTTIFKRSQSDALQEKAFVVVVVVHVQTHIL